MSTNISYWLGNLVIIYLCHVCECKWNKKVEDELTDQAK